MLKRLHTASQMGDYQRNQADLKQEERQQAEQKCNAEIMKDVTKTIKTQDNN